LAATGLGGCGLISEKFGQTVADAPLVGLPAGAPQRPATSAAYPAVHSMPSARPAVLTGVEQNKIEDELVAARNRQQNLASQPASPPSDAPAFAPAPAPAPAAKKPEPAARPSSSSQSIY
jgi:hypothetical protein